MKKKILKYALVGTMLTTAGVYPTQLVKAESLPSVKTYNKNGNDVLKKESVKRFVLLKTANSSDEAFRDVVKLLQSEFAEKQILDNATTPIFLVSQSEVKPGDVVFALDFSVEAEDGYKVTIGKEIKITAKTARGILYGGRTALQYFLTEGQIPNGEISDQPILKERSFHIDIARKFYTKNWIIDRIKEASWLKLNTVQLHFSENEGFRIESKTHPEVLSKEYITQEELKEILAVAKQYHVDVIPSLDSPGHLKQALKTHPDYQLSLSDTGLDISNPEARKFIKELYAEYAELFKGCTHFHIGGDEFINFDRFFLYPELGRYAKETLKIQDGTGIDTYIDFVNEIANFVESKGFTARVWNDGFHRLNQIEHVHLKDSIEIAYWTRWDRNMAKIDAFINENRKIINFNDAYFYYVLGELAGYKYPKGEKIYNNWTPGDTPSTDYTTLPEQLIGASFSIWSDKATAQTEQEVAAGIREPLRAMAERAWNGSTNTKSYQEFLANLNKMRAVPSNPVSKDVAVLEESKASEVVVHFKDEKGNDVQATKTVYGEAGKAYDLSKLAELYGYVFEKADKSLKADFVKGKTEIVLTFKKTLDTGKLKEVIAHSKHPEGYTKESYAEYGLALEKAKKGLFEPADLTQTGADKLADTLKEKEKALVPLHNVLLQQLLTLRADEAEYTAVSYDKYVKAQKVVESAVTSLDKATVVDAYKNLMNAYVGLVEEDTNTLPDDFDFLMFKDAISEDEEDEFSFDTSIGSIPEINTEATNDTSEDATDDILANSEFIEDEVDKSTLEEAIKNLEQLNLNDYEEVSRELVSATIAKAKELMKEDIKESTMEKMLEVMDLIKDNLMLKVNRDIKSLEQLVSEAQEYDLTKYEVSSTLPLTKALVLAQAAVNDQYANDKTVQDAYKELEMAIKELALLPEKPLLMEKAPEVEQKSEETNMPKPVEQVNNIGTVKQAKTMKKAVETSDNQSVSFVGGIIALFGIITLKRRNKK